MIGVEDKARTLMIDGIERGEAIRIANEFRSEKSNSEPDVRAVIPVDGRGWLVVHRRLWGDCMHGAFVEKDRHTGEVRVVSTTGPMPRMDNFVDIAAGRPTSWTPGTPGEGRA